MLCYVLVISSPAECLMIFNAVVAIKTMSESIKRHNIQQSSRNQKNRDGCCCSSSINNKNNNNLNL